jgi:shikimate kinase
VIFLIGYRGCGKTTVAKLLAVALGWSWLDADEVLERKHGRTIRDIFATEGEERFRDKEDAILADLCQLSRHVIATGGGVVLREQNRQRLRAAGCVVWLRAGADALHQRLQGDASTWDRRPALTAAPAREEIALLLRSREPHYDSCAHLTVCTEGRSPADVVKEVLKSVGEWCGVSPPVISPQPAG